MPDYNPVIIENYLTNVDEIMHEIDHHGKFTRRHKGDARQHQAKTDGPISRFSSWFSKDMPQHTIDAIWKTIPHDRKHCTQLVINKYEPGDFLVKHCDAQGGYWQFKLIYLTEGPPHFCWYDADDKPNFVQESKGSMFQMDIGLYHEVTEILPEEPTKFSLCLIYE